MAKFGRYDPRNKKKDRNKNHSLNKDNRIRETDQMDDSQVLLREVLYEDDYIDDGTQQLNS
jgi:hypothetical protein